MTWKGHDANGSPIVHPDDGAALANNDYDHEELERKRALRAEVIGLMASMTERELARMRDHGLWLKWSNDVYRLGDRGTPLAGSGMPT